nr:hypothetical protein [Streptomyces poriferorum]
MVGGITLVKDEPDGTGDTEVLPVVTVRLVFATRRDGIRRPGPRR